MLPIWLLPILKNRWTWYILAALVVLMLILGYGAYRERQGVKKGQEEEKDRWTEQVEEMRQADREALDTLIQQANEKLAEAQARYLGAVAREQAKDQVIQSLAGQRALGLQGVAHLTDSALHDYIVGQLKLRPAGDLTAGYLPAEERELARCVTDYPLCQEQNRELGEQVGIIKEQVIALNEKVGALEQKDQAKTVYIGKLEGYYTQLYNAFPRKRRSWKCLGLWHCGEAKKLPVPDPVEVKSAAPQP